MKDQTRRQFLRLATGATLSAPLLAVHVANAASMTPLSETEGMGKNLNYKKNAVEAVSITGYKKGSRCDNCLHYIADVKGCRIIPGSSVEPAGWCSVWAAKPQ